MKRRTFLKSGSLLIPAFIGGLSLKTTRQLFAMSSENSTFSLSIITDQPSVTIHKIENLFRFSEFQTLNINFSEQKLIGEQVADIAFVRGNSLINYLNSDDGFSTHLKKIANSFSFPRKVTNPTLLEFSAGTSGKPEYFNISIGNNLYKRIPVNTKNGIYEVAGKNGKIEFEISNETAKIHSSSCKHKTCLKMGEIKNPGESLVCIPNQISISVSGKSNSKIDSVTF